MHQWRNEVMILGVATAGTVWPLTFFDFWLRFWLCVSTPLSDSLILDRTFWLLGFLGELRNIHFFLFCLRLLELVWLVGMIGKFLLSVFHLFPWRLYYDSMKWHELRTMTWTFKGLEIYLWWWKERSAVQDQLWSTGLIFGVIISQNRIT